MAEIKDKILKEEYRDKIVTITDFRKNYAGGISSQAIDYAIANDLIDYADLGKRARVIVLTEKTLGYVPNKSPKRFKSTMEA